MLLSHSTRSKNPKESAILQSVGSLKLAVKKFKLFGGKSEEQSLPKSKMCQMPALTSPLITSLSLLIGVPSGPLLRRVVALFFRLQKERETKERRDGSTEFVRATSNTKKGTTRHEAVSVFVRNTQQEIHTYNQASSSPPTSCC